jgi:hypothetical protein
MQRINTGPSIDAYAIKVENEAVGIISSFLEGGNDIRPRQSRLIFGQQR